MTNKTHAELLPCPHCGELPTYETFPPYSTPHDAYEGEENVYCNSEKCQKLMYEGVIHHWNARVNKEAEFLEELKNTIKGKVDFMNEIMGEDFDSAQKRYLVSLLKKIEQFEAEKKADRK